MAGRMHAYAQVAPTAQAQMPIPVLPPAPVLRPIEQEDEVELDEILDDIHHTLLVYGERISAMEACLYAHAYDSDDVPTPPMRIIEEIKDPK